MVTDPNSNVNVTLQQTASARRRTFPCPLCGSALDLRRSRTDKPYSICDQCGIQIFFVAERASRACECSWTATGSTRYHRLACSERRSPPRRDYGSTEAPAMPGLIRSPLLLT